MRKQHEKILETARQLNIKIQDVSDVMGSYAAILEYEGKSELIVRGTPTSLVNLRTLEFCNNKNLTKDVFERLNISYPKSILFKSADEKELKDFFETGKTYVCKPSSGTNGIGVELNIKTPEDIERYLQKNKTSETDFFMLEEQVFGEDLRVQVIEGKISAVCTRKPAFVTGDGKQTLQELIDEYGEIVKKQNPANELVINKFTHELLQKQSIKFEDIPAKDREITLGNVCNMAQGAVAVDKTDEIHSEFQGWIDRLTKYLDTGYFAIDIIAKDCQKPPTENAWALEINARPGWLHHTFSKNKKHDIEKILLETVLLREKKSR